MKNRKQLEQDLMNALERCWYLPKEEKAFWTANITGIPDHTLKNVLKEISSKNAIMNKSLKTAIEANPNNNFLKEIKSKINQIKQTAFDIEEESSKESLDRKLEEQMENL